MRKSHLCFCSIGIMSFMTWINLGSVAWCQKHTWLGVQLPLGISDLCRLFDSVFASDCLCMGEQTGGGWIQRMSNFLPAEWYLVSPQMRPNFTQKTSQKLLFLKIPDPYPQIRICFLMQLLSSPLCQWAKLLYAWLHLCLGLIKHGIWHRASREWPGSCKITLKELEISIYRTKRMLLQN